MKKLGNICIGFVFILIWVQIIDLFLHSLGIPFNTNRGDTSFKAFIFGCILAPIWESIAFVYAPMRIVRHFGEDLLWPVLGITCALFGWAHGFGTISLLVQGVMGAVFCWVYLKNEYSYWSAVLLHALWNFSVMYLLK